MGPRKILLLAPDIQEMILNSTHPVNLTLADFMDPCPHLWELRWKQFGFETALVEEYLSGKKFTVAIIANHGKLIIAAVEIIAPAENGIRILGKAVKTNNTEILKKITNLNTLFRVKEIAEQSFFALGVRDFGRIDIRMNHNEPCYFIEANLVPGMKKGSSYFPQACQIDADLNYDAVVQHMIQGAAKRMV